MPEPLYVVDDGTIDVSQIADNVVDAGKVDKKLAGIVGGTGTVAIGYNPEVFKEAGIEEPNQDGSAWTWDEFVETAKTIKEKTGKYGICSGVADDTNIFNYWVRSHGSSFLVMITNHWDMMMIRFLLITLTCGKI